jgi:hypothetical protein
MAAHKNRQSNDIVAMLPWTKQTEAVKIQIVVRAASTTSMIRTRATTIPALLQRLSPDGSVEMHWAVRLRVSL